LKLKWKLNKFKIKQILTINFVEIKMEGKHKDDNDLILQVEELN